MFLYNVQLLQRLFHQYAHPVRWSTVAMILEVSAYLDFQLYTQLSVDEEFNTSIYQYVKNENRIFSESKTHRNGFRFHEVYVY